MAPPADTRSGFGPGASLQNGDHGEAAERRMSANEWYQAAMKASGGRSLDDGPSSGNSSSAGTRPSDRRSTSASPDPEIAYVVSDLDFAPEPEAQSGPAASSHLGKAIAKDPKPPKALPWAGERPDEEVRSQPDVVFKDGRLRMPLDGPELLKIMERLENDETLCFKMRWYVAKHLRREYTQSLQPSRQPYAGRIRTKYYTHSQWVNGHPRPYNRLDFEAVRTHWIFRKDQSQWELKGKYKILQSAYETFNWNPVITDDDVDDILRVAGASLADFDKAPRVERQPHASSSLTSPVPFVITHPEPSLHQNTGIPPAGTPTAGTPKIGTPKTRTPPTADQSIGHRSLVPRQPKPIRPEPMGLQGEIKRLRTEIVELREAAQAERELHETSLIQRDIELKEERKFRATLLAEFRASQELILAELRALGGAEEEARKRRRLMEG
ncbi:hypothetical protein F4780DRAFT_750799 [Xylariomycetidae sp. FL0641]|nr:hypothetical protein F4780DRAFT_750799 [Xylariomycetidae sp. FL0641]